MLLYFDDTGSSDASWFNVANWWQDAACTINNGALPAYGDSVTLAPTCTTNVQLGGGYTVDLGSGYCDFAFTLTGAIINGGLFTAPYSVFASGIISGGTFSGDFFSVSGGTMSAAIGGGTFTSPNMNCDAAIFGGTFNCANFISAGTISGGTFTCQSFTSTSTITGGAYLPVGTVAYSVLIVSGVCTYDPGTVPADPGFVAGGGTYTPTVMVTGLPVPSDILGAGLL